MVRQGHVLLGTVFSARQCGLLLSGLDRQQGGKSLEKFRSHQTKQQEEVVKRGVTDRALSTKEYLLQQGPLRPMQAEANLSLHLFCLGPDWRLRQSL